MDENEKALLEPFPLPLRDFMRIEYNNVGVREPAFSFHDTTGRLTGEMRRHERDLLTVLSSTLDAKTLRRRVAELHARFAAEIDTVELARAQWNEHTDRQYAEYYAKKDA